MRNSMIRKGYDLCDICAFFHPGERGFLHPIIFKYLYTVGLLSPHTLASSDTFICPFIRLG